ncbi:uncharacterized protein LOC101241731 [Hydra vulgaris]|uniref:uncharacterized protein LOC101241731 n=1 Tax=Hydra vulgaris TaxID=6087 RepID=UPI00064128E3|nr:uncharacterized protein LOC101241731 [Hydra vulgaris]
MNPMQRPSTLSETAHIASFALLSSSCACCKGRCQYRYTVPCSTLQYCSPLCSSQVQIPQAVCLTALSTQLIPQVQMASCCCQQQVQSVMPLIQPTSSFSRCHHQQTHSSSNLVRRVHLTSDNVTYPTPYYATSFVPLPNTHHSWEPTTGYRGSQYSQQYDMHLRNNETHAPEYHSHIHHHVNRNHPLTMCTRDSTSEVFSLVGYTSHVYFETGRYITPTSLCSNRSSGNREGHRSESRFHMRQSSRTSSYPYPQIIHPVSYQYPTFPTSRTFPYLISVEAEPINDWETQEKHKFGLKKEQIEMLPHYTLTKYSMADFTADERCVICMCEYAVEEKLRILPCAHEFHSECVDQWLETSSTCPICRHVVDEGQ